MDKDFLPGYLVDTFFLNSCLIYSYLIVRDFPVQVFPTLDSPAQAFPEPDSPVLDFPVLVFPAQVRPAQAGCSCGSPRRSGTLSRSAARARPVFDFGSHKAMLPGIKSTPSA